MMSRRSRARWPSACAFLPPDDVVPAFEKLQQKFDPDEKALQLYFERTCIGRSGAGGRRAPQFPIAMRNAFDRLDRRYTRTNNAVDGFHNAVANYPHQSVEIFRQP